MSQDWYIKTVDIPYNNLKTIESISFTSKLNCTLLYFVTTIKTLNHFCSLFPSPSAMFFTTRRRNRLQMFAPLETKFGMFTLYSPPPFIYCDLFFILAGISPYLVAFLEGKLKDFFFTSSSLTFHWNFWLDLEWIIVNLILWTLSWFCILSRFFLRSILVGLSFRWVVMFVK